MTQKEQEYDDEFRRLIDRHDYTRDQTIQELWDHVVRKGLDPGRVRIQGTVHFKWLSSETDEERKTWEEAVARHARRTEEWERETYERLRAKFDPDPAAEEQPR
jgi:hypothetical protein